MFNGQYKSINTVIERILQDTDYYNEINKDDIVEWAIRAMELIGAPLAQEEAIDVVEVANYRATIPSYVREILAVRDHYSRHTLIQATGDFTMYNYTDATNPDTEFDDPIVPEDNRKMKHKPLIIPAYIVKSGYLFLNVKDGAIDIKYAKIPLDDNGDLLIPDVERYLQAVQAYITYKMDKKLARRGVLSSRIADESEREWLWYVNSAFTKLVTPNSDGAESLKNQIVKMRTDKNAHDYGFEHLNKPTVKKF